MRTVVELAPSEVSHSRGYEAHAVVDVVHLPGQISARQFLALLLQLSRRL